MNNLTSFKEFSQRVSLSRQDICREIFEDNRQHIKIKKEKTVVKNLVRIFDAALKISNQTGFQAMSMRSLSRETGLSMGGLYAYFSGKEDLLEMLHSIGHTTTWRTLEENLNGLTDPVARLRVAIQTHLFLSEVMQPWFYFSYMEARHLPPTQKERSKNAELETERLYADIIDDGVRQGCFAVDDVLLAASVIKAMLQDWYIKRWKYAKRGVSVDRYGLFLVDLVEAFCLAPEYRKRKALERGDDGLFGPAEGRPAGRRAADRGN
ncbi:MAG: TetR/AcrR family transcriptional regulator [Proteobacteria bacterium]|nr:TetR/AcrR family transcriptional regulator [Pseudomonadota bacterium]